MNYPSIKEYKEAILFAEDNFDQLKHLRPVLDEDGQPVMSSGGFAVVFKMKDELTGKPHAVKCFLKNQEGRAEAYRQIAEELEFVSSTFLTPIKYLDKELFVDTKASDDTEFPVLLMDWVEGETLDKYIRKHLNDQYELSLLAYQFSRLAMWLMPQPFAHGDLKPDNILVKEDGMQPVFNLGTYRLRHAGTLDIACGILGLTGKTDVQPLLRILPHRGLIFTDVTCYGLSVKTNSTGYLPQTQTINAMVMKDLFFLIHLNHFKTLCTLNSTHTSNYFIT